MDPTDELLQEVPRGFQQILLQQMYAKGAANYADVVFHQLAIANINQNNGLTNILVSGYHLY